MSSLSFATNKYLPSQKKCFQNYKRNSVAITLPLRKEGFELLPFHRVRKIRNLKQTLSNDSYFYFTYLLFLGKIFLHIFLQKTPHSWAYLNKFWEKKGFFFIIYDHCHCHYMVIRRCYDFRFVMLYDFHCHCHCHIFVFPVPLFFD